MSCIAKAFCIDFADIFGPRRPRCKPTCFGLHLDAAERLTIARRGCSHCANGIAGKFLNAERLGSYFLERVLELPSRGISIRS